VQELELPLGADRESIYRWIREAGLHRADPGNDDGITQFEFRGVRLPNRKFLLLGKKIRLYS
jgi:hypothetical protein